jgi:polar amino acid transport system substrate-binding protein
MRHLTCFQKILFLLGSFLLPLITVNQALTSTDPPFLLVEDPWPPYTVGQTGDLAEKGLIVELMHELFARIDHPIQLELYPWKRCIFMVKNNKADALMLTVKTAERDQFAYFPEAFFVNKINFYHKSGEKISWKKFSDLKGYTIGLVAGAKYSQEFQDAIKQIPLKTETVSDISTNLRKLQADRIDLTPILDVVAAELISASEEFCGHFEATSNPLRTTPMQMAIARSSGLMSYSTQINKVIREMKEDGTVDRIYNKYVPKLEHP